jgi:hypothetical protein
LPLDYTGTDGELLERRKGRESNPKAAKPNRWWTVAAAKPPAPLIGVASAAFATNGVPRRRQPFLAYGPGRSRTCTTPIKSRRLFLVSFVAKGVSGGDRTCDAPRFRRALLPLSYGHVTDRDRRSWSRTSGLLRIRQVLSR